MAAGNEVVEIFSGVAENVIVSLADCVCTGLPLSCTLTVNVDVVPLVGVPEISPVEARVSPAGRLPADIDQTYPGVPPVAASVAEYVDPVVAEGRDAAEICSCVAVILMVSEAI